MAALSWLFDLFGEYNKYRPYLPSALFAYLYYLSNESVFVLTAVIFAAIATGIIESREKQTRMMRAGERHEGLTSEEIRDIYHSQWLERIISLLMTINAIGYLVAAAAGWNNIVAQGLMLPSLPTDSGTGFINVLLSDYVSTPDIVLIALLFLILVVIMRTLLRGLVEIIYRKG